MDELLAAGSEGRLLPLSIVAWPWLRTWPDPQKAVSDSPLLAVCQRVSTFSLSVLQLLCVQMRAGFCGERCKDVCGPVQAFERFVWTVSLASEANFLSRHRPRSL